MNTATRPTLITVAEGASPLDVLAARHRAAWDKTQHGRQEWIEGTLELAAVLAEERKLLPSDQDFSRWLERNKLAKINAHDRIALIGMAKDLAVTREVLEKTDRTSWQHIWEKELRTRVAHVSKPRPAPKKRSKAERQIIEKVLDLHCKRGHSYDETAEELGLTRGQVAGIVRRNDASNPEAPPPPPPKRREFTGLKTLTREQVDPDFVGDDVQFAAKYGHVWLHTKAEIEENKRQEALAAWLGAVSDLERAARAFTAEAPDQNTLRQWLTKSGKAEKLGAWLTTIETACRNIAPYIDLVRAQKKP